mmetsp:Transcript_14121/g.30202  ORF Transcript_14121/g.30202 Transcript_14121/m.30202 type:complete len:730 (-) Transcript_14121:291-2480(-)|eukprot:CAMPEP_0118934678 /NCGR_PEP_ID=MMETSP1169-20130426/13955_1 /TAXON_ID=36882 /ORGANISM="Pyramimonas obovata, Strain CCMP722" /LENGTH=729 /DNA_ID=CAMNT_0006877605 /DNA_START=227 /DNA_END=2416 /DNA_ORIENTATION=+
MSSDSEDDLPLASRSKVLVSNGKNGDDLQVPAAEVPSAPKVQVKQEAPGSGSVVVKQEEGEPAAPSTKPADSKSPPIPAKGVKREHSATTPLAPKPKDKPESAAGVKVKSEDPAPVAKKAGVAVKKVAAPPAKKVKTENTPSYSSSESDEESSSESDDSSDSDDEPLSKRVKTKTPAKKVSKPAAKRTPAAAKTPQSTSKGKSARMWETLEHAGVLFPPAYEPHGVPLVYDGEDVTLNALEEEVASMFAIMKDTDYAAKPVFLKNFFTDFVEVLTPDNKRLLRKFSLIDFTKIYMHLIAVREKKKEMTKEEKLAIKAAKDEQEKDFLYATIDGRREKVGNFRVEPPGLFRGRGEHPKMGKLKSRIMPEDVIINIGEKAPVPPCPVPGHKWGEVRHDHGVTWLAGWKDSINTKDWKYVQFAAQSTIKGVSDLKKYEKARKLKDYIDVIRQNYRKGWTSKDAKVAQMSMAVYLIDKLALRAGGEKDDDLADTVGCCTLRVGHVFHEPPSSIKFDFLGKDSIRYEQTHEVDPLIYEGFQRLKAGKKGEDDLFDLIDPPMVNTHLQGLMEGLTIKVFRTYNASITLDTLLQNTKEGTIPEKKAQYDAANKEVAILCNHQKGVSKAHDTSMAKMQEKRDQIETELKEAKKGGKDERTLKKIATLKDRLAKHELQMSMKEELKTVSLGTSKINYLDPRITIAWCKTYDVQIHVVFPKALLEKFNWAMEVEPEFRF